MKNLLKRYFTMFVIFFLAGCGRITNDAGGDFGPASKSFLKSITGDDYTAKKYYFGFGEYLDGSMGNETKYDVKHTHDIFTKHIGGDYTGTTLVDRDFGGSDIKKVWSDVKGKIGKEDMYLQYSSGHGSSSGLQVGVSYNEIRDNALSYPAREIIVFMMSCLSGNLVDRFNDKRSVWGNWQAQGRTLYVMASSKSSENSSTGPGTDSDEPGGPSGSAGSAFGHALWKALIGYADGYVDGVKDGLLTLEEIREYSIWKTQQVGGHTPVSTGAYRPELVMNRSPKKKEIQALLSDVEYQALLAEDSQTGEEGPFDE